MAQAPTQATGAQDRPAFCQPGADQLPADQLRDGQLPADRILSDLHTHTDFSHGKGTPEQNVLAAVALGFKRIAVTEHAGGHVFFGVRGKKLLRFRQEMARLAQRYGSQIQVLCGMECNLWGFGECDAPRDRSPYDLLLLAYHKGVPPKDKFALSCAMEAAGLREADPVKVAESLLLAADRYKIDILAHPGEYVRCDIPTLAKGAAQLGVTIEINARHVTLSPEDIRVIHNAGAKLRINSDAHSPGRVGEFTAALEAAAAAGVIIQDE